MVLVFGIVSLLLPVYGIVFGGMAWGFGNREIREIKAGLRVASGRTKARVGRVLGIIGTLLWAAILVLVVVAVIADDSGTTYDSNTRADDWFTANEVTFVYPESWNPQNFDMEGPPEPVWTYVVTPDKGSGNWIAFYYYPNSVAADYGATSDTFNEAMATFLQGDTTLTNGPDHVTIDGHPGRQFGVADIMADQIDQPFNSEIVILYGDEASYGFQVQYLPGSEDIMLDAWQTMLANVDLPSSATTIEEPGSPV